MKQKKSMSKQSRKLWIIVNYLSIIFILGFYYAGKYYDWSTLLLVGEVVSIILLIISFVAGYIKTHLWKMSHTSSKNLDERQLQVMLVSLKNSYSIFSIVTIIIIYGFAVVEKGPIDVVIAVCLLYLAHTLPAAITGWKENVI